MTSDERFEETLNHLTRDGRAAFTVPEVCTAAGISASYFWKLCAAGKIDTVAFGKRARRVTAHELARLIAYGIPA